MGDGLLVALTGTPGTGKSSVSLELERRGFRVFDIGEMAHEFNLFEGYDEARGCGIYDIEALSKRVVAMASGPSEISILEGVVSHLLPVDTSIVLRCRPSILEERLRDRNYSPEKIRENMEAEALNEISVESHERVETYEVDTTSQDISEVADAIELIIEGRGSRYRKRLDFMEEVIDWY